MTEWNSISFKWRFGPPVLIECPPQMVDPVREVLSGEYESGYSGENLTILDIGANVGAFSIRAHRRWPRSRIIAYEPEPRTFSALQRNVRALKGIECINAAVFPGEGKSIELFSRYPGDGEAGVMVCTQATFEPSQQGDVLDVPLVHPSDLPCADVVKIDVEGAEAEVVRHMDLSSLSLLLLEYQNLANRRAIRQMLDRSFEIVGEDEFSWDALLPGGRYRSSLKGDKYGHMFFVRRGASKVAFKPLRAPFGRALASTIRRKLKSFTG